VKTTVALVMAVVAVAAWAQASDVFPTSAGDLRITFIGHGTLMLQVGSTVVHVDPVGRYADYGRLPRADLILITHEHGDHLDPATIDKLRKDGTVILANAASAARVPGSRVVGNGDAVDVKEIGIEVIPAYNTSPARLQYHPRGRDNGYLLTVGGERILIAGDTEDIPEIRALKEIDVAFLPMNLPFTMTPEQVAAAAAAFRPKVLYPYHYGETSVALLQNLLKTERGIEVRIRQLQ
jgi:L-ascorbate metabolism protein UlaG (beta-lactamase superfamily)